MADDKLKNNVKKLREQRLLSKAELARKAGLSVEQFHSVIGAGRMRCGFYDTFIQWSLGRPNAHAFTISNAHKDMRYLAAMAADLGGVNPMQLRVQRLERPALPDDGTPDDEHLGCWLSGLVPSAHLCYAAGLLAGAWDRMTRKPRPRQARS